jgi:DNA-binding transcriptional ArsR family regulator
MNDGPDISEAASLIGDPARARMLTVLLDGRAWTATELSLEAGVGAPTASAHLAKLLAGGLISDMRQGRHRYFKLAGLDVASALEALLVLSARTAPTKRLPGPRDERLRFARSCYGHLAGTLGVRLFQHLEAQGWLCEDAHGWHFSPTGATECAAWIGVEIGNLAHKGHACLDWSERRPHLGGKLGRALLQRLVEQDMCVVGPARIVTLTARGEYHLSVLVD